MWWEVLLVTFVTFYVNHSCTSQPTLNGDNRPVVDVAQGRIIGVQETQNNIPMLIYRSIPFAKPPINELRFMPPVPADPWIGDLDAAAMPNACPQQVVGKEDCLYLNVYTPIDALYTNITKESMPVMIMIHGGGFVTGSVESFDKTYPLVEHGVIVVLIQYRLGILGFLSSDDDVVPGNMGLKDQTEAIKWIYNNIEMFGGDHEKITIFGQSAGGASTHYQVLSPYASGYFQNAIFMSGNAFMPWAIGRDFYNTSRALGQRFDCPDVDNSTELISCLQNVNYLILSDMVVAFFEWNFQPFSFAPRIDGDYIPDHPASLMKQGLYNKVPCMMGAVRNEGAIESGEMYAKPFLIHSLMENFTINGPVNQQLFEDEDPVNTAYEAYEYYLGGINITEDNADNFTKFLTDRLFHVELDWLVQQQAYQSEVYMYQFDYRGQFGYMDTYENIGLNLTAAKQWISHSDDLQYIFQLKEASGPEENINDMTVRTIYSKLFTNFAKFGTPTPNEEFLGFLWPATNSSQLRHLSIALPTTMDEDSRQDVREFWQGLPLRINSILQE